MQSEDRVEVSVREAFASDAPRIVALAAQLGYVIRPEHAQKQLAGGVADRRIFVAVVPRVGVIGWIGLLADESLLAERRTYVEGLVVEDEYRSNGVGAALLARAEEWARERACSSVCVRSNVTRERARGFYERAGYDVLKMQTVFGKSL